MLRSAAVIILFCGLNIITANLDHPLVPPQSQAQLALAAGWRLEGRYANTIEAELMANSLRAYGYLVCTTSALNGFEVYSNR